MVAQTMIAMGMFAAQVGATAGTPAPSAWQADPMTAAYLARHYPADARARGQEGVVGFEVELDRGGKLARCRVTRSSGVASLDEATCGSLADAANFSPAGTRTAAGFRRSGELVWRLPADPVRKTVFFIPDLSQPAAAPASAERNGEEAGLVCRRQFKHGSLTMKERVCLSEADWDRQLAYARQQLITWTTPAGTPAP